MTKLEKVLKELRWLQFNFPWQDNPENDVDKMSNAIHKYTGDAIELLESQQPRVLTLEEVIKHYSLPPVVLDDLGWQEDYLQDIKPLYFDFPTKDSFAVHWRGYQHVRAYLEDWNASYGQKWRCWTDKPTDAQRKAVKWDET